MVEITNRKEAEAWLETQSHQKCVWMAARSAARFLPALAAEPEGETFDRLVFATFRAMLISAGAANCPPAEMNRLSEAAATAAYSAEAATAATAASYASRAAAADAASAADAAADAAASASYAADASPTAGSYASAYAAFSVDTEATDSWPVLWPENVVPPGLAKHWDTLQQRLRAEPQTWGWWLDWYQGLLDGTPKPWPLIFDLALKITQEDWEHKDGPAHVAGCIKRIEDEWREAQNAGGEAPAPEDVVPDNVSSLFRNAPVVRASLGSLTQSISLRTNALDRQQQSNEPVPFVETYRRIAGTADRTSAVLEQGPGVEDANYELAMQVGQLRSEATLLKSQLDEALREIATLKKEIGALETERDAAIAKLNLRRLLTAVGAFVGMPAAVVATLWTVTGEEEFLQKRWNNIAVEFGFIEEKFGPILKGYCAPPVLELPDTHET